MIFLSIFSFRTATYKNESRVLFVVLGLIGVAFFVYGSVTTPKYARIQTETKKKLSQKESEKAAHLSSHAQNTVFDDGTAKKQAAAQKLHERNVEKQLKSEYRQTGNLTFNRRTKTYSLTITDRNFIKAMTYLKQSPSQANQLKWPRTVNNFKVTSQSIKKSLGKGYTLQIQAAIPKTETLLRIRDGQVITNFVK
ncbi:hypothetical protein ACFQ22_02235 [Lentilactobacillus raoultii]|uniref:Uncharacterized protein n=1 Tax=Lentilactobacillus raoultii TaxID=1987503 RepID=A0ABW3PG11_9LACO|nr:hypothetical protein [Lentilactobacillus raoultii]